MDLQESNVQRQRRTIRRLERWNVDLAAKNATQFETIARLEGDVERMAAVNRRQATDLDMVRRENRELKKDRDLAESA